MSSAEFNVGSAAPSKLSSRVLKPPGGDSSIFTNPEVKEHRARNMKNQQNSSCMNEVMGTVDPNTLMSQNDHKAPQQEPAVCNREHVQHSVEAKNNGLQEKCQVQDKPNSAQNGAGAGNGGGRGKVPPGGFSAGFW